MPDADTRTLLTQLQAAHAAARGPARRIRWVDAAALHLTLRFLGDTSDAQVEYFRRILPELAQRIPPLRATRCAIWPNRARPRLLVLELDTPEELRVLARTCESHAREAGHAPEPRPFRAHVTLARLRPGSAPGVPPAPDRKLSFEAVALMQSRLGRQAARYIELARADLGS